MFFGISSTATSTTATTTATATAGTTTATATAGAGIATAIPRETGALPVLFARGVAPPFSAFTLHLFGIMLVVLEVLAIHFESVAAVEFVSSTCKPWVAFLQATIPQTRHFFTSSTGCSPDFVKVGG